MRPPNPPFKKDFADGTDRRILGKVLTGLGFSENVRGRFLSGTSPGTSDTEFAVAHNLGYIPQGWLSFGHNQAGTLYKGTTAWTKTTIYLKANVASLGYTIFVH